MFKEIYNGYQVNKEGVVLGRRGQPLSQHDNGRGYLIVSLILDGKYTSKAVHRLVAEAFLDNPNNYSDVNHIDCDRRNNKVENLEWMTHGNNIKYSYDNEKRSAVGESNARCKTTEKIVVEICELLQQGLKPSKVRDMGYYYNLVRSIKQRRLWTSISKDYVW
jgi:hypothetical protein